ncbi:MAG TPA: M1 family aminopeptidase [Acidobacteriota bacterium]|nr:M1 family aminopeptidase [Acidobacteriota bacterium]
MQYGRLGAWILLITMTIGCGSSPPYLEWERGVSQRLAQDRSQRLSQLRYGISLRIPEERSRPIEGTVVARFNLSSDEGGLALDFNAPAQQVKEVRAAGLAVEAGLEDGHILLPSSALVEGVNQVEVDFIAGDSSLNRRDEYLYTLFVPDRASTSLPLFDQPNLKARFTLQLELPESWTALANGAQEECSVTEQGRKLCSFAETEPIPTYLLAFAAGRFQVEEWQGEGYPMRFWHRESDAQKVERNREEIFRLHQQALQWLEDYTGIRYPFAKFDFALIPSFQYGGMEHPGAIFYRDTSLFLEESSTQAQQLGRASLIAHETAHQWFGDLVTMDWFNDVWTKEVFANFMAAKIVHPSFPEVDHELRFLLTHYPSAHAVDRSAGANAIRQDLDNLLEAGTLYGAIIYQKAPIVMKHLELLVGEEAMREGLRRYLSRFAYANATWPDLIEILDAASPLDLKSWSQVWVEEPGRPHIRSEVEWAADGSVISLTLHQSDPWERGRRWTQDLKLLLAGPSQDSAFGRRALIPLRLQDASVGVAEAAGFPASVILPNGAGIAYGRFQLDQRSLDYLLQHLEEMDAPLQRAVAWINLWEAFLNAEIESQSLLATALAGLEREPVEQIAERLLADLQTLYWNFLPAPQRLAHAPAVEDLLWRRMQQAETSSLKKTFFDAYLEMALTDSALQRMKGFLQEQQAPAGVTLSDADYSAMALLLAVHEVDGWDELLKQQTERLENPERRQRLEFIRPAVDADPSRRQAFFESLEEAQQRRREPWVITALQLLHHPLRAQASRPLLPAALQMLPEIQRTGDIFFPKRWLDAVLGGHSSGQAAEAVRTYLERSPDLPQRLRGKVLQSADLLFRAARQSPQEQP